MKVLFVAPFGLRRKTTVWARTLPLAQGLRARGWEPTILIPPWDSPEDADRTLVDEGIPLVNVSLQGGLPATIGRLLTFIRREKPAIVHIVKPRAHAGIVQWLLWQARRLGDRGPLILLDVDDWEQAWAQVNEYGPKVARFLAWQEEWGLRHAHGITAASRWLEARATAYAPAIPRLYLPNGVSHREHPAPPTGAARTPTVLYFTRYAEVGPQWLADFVCALGVLHPRVRLIVAGAPLRPGADEPFREAIASLHDRAVPTRSTGQGSEQDGADSATNSGAATAALHETAMTSRKPVAISAHKPEVIFLGSVAPETLPALHAAAHVAIFPARAEPLQEAKCSVRLATTLLAGTPVVASAVGEQAHFGAGGAACLLPPTASPADFARAVAGLLGAPAERSRMVERARVHLGADYSWSGLSARLAAFYDERLSSRK